MMPEKAREPFKTALAIVISYGIALAMDWDNPYWAAFAVAFVSLSTAGQSFASQGRCRPPVSCRGRLTASPALVAGVRASRAGPAG